MKLLHFITGMAVVALAACSNDSLVDPNAADPRTQNVAIGFNGGAGNMSRAVTNNLQKVHKDFGVWGYKGNAFTAVTTDPTTATTAGDPNVIMANYLVGWTGTAETGVGNYTAPTAPSASNGESAWYYEGFGSSDDDPGSTASENENQYLKYWDDSYTYSYFFAYAPYYVLSETSNGTTTKSYVTFDRATATLSFPGKFWANSSSSGDWMYGSAKATNTSHATVPIEFKRLAALVQVAVYEDVKGYKVYMDNVKFATKSGNAYSGKTMDGIVTIPYSYDEDDGYSVEDFIIGAKATVAFTDGTTAITATSSYTDAVWDSPYGEYTINGLTNTTTANGNTYISTSSGDNASFSPTTWYMVPNTTNNPGFQVVMSYTLVSEDTGELIHVKGARVNVEPQYTKWAANTLYKYIFKITSKSTGTTGTPDPDPDPDVPTPALYPIIFDGITVTDLSSSGVTEEFEIGGTKTDSGDNSNSGDSSDTNS